MSTSLRLFRAATVVPVAQPAIADGAIVVRDGRIAAVGRYADLRGSFDGEVCDLGEALILPGLVNAHCHLDLSMMRRAILSPSSFASWIQRLNALKRSLGMEDYTAAIRQGAWEAVAFGTTAIGSIQSQMDIIGQTGALPLRVVWFAEVMDIRSRPALDDNFELLRQKLGTAAESREWLGISPHAPYTTSCSLYRQARSLSEKHGLPFATHVAESREEYEMFRNGTGHLHGFLQGLGRNMGDTGARSSFAALVREDVLPKGALLVHMNEVDEADWEILRKAGRRFSVAHCPRSHRYFGHRRFRLREMLECGVNVCIGTDSLASAPDLNLFSELRLLLEEHPELSSEDVLRMATTTAAKAIGIEGLVGALVPNALADFQVVEKVDSVEEIIREPRRPSAVFVGGELADLSRQSAEKSLPGWKGAA